MLSFVTPFYSLLFLLFLSLSQLVMNMTIWVQNAVEKYSSQALRSSKFSSIQIFEVSSTSCFLRVRINLWTPPNELIIFADEKNLFFSKETSLFSGSKDLVSITHILSQSSYPRKCPVLWSSSLFAIILNRSRFLLCSSSLYSLQPKKQLASEVLPEYFTPNKARVTIFLRFGSRLGSAKEDIISFYLSY